jgi:peptidoglycan/LPS O-acetylase OafA/YrhL
VLAFHCRFPILPGGYVGVDVFFVLSGYLITTLLRREIALTGNLALGRFYYNRALRLYPPLLLMLAVYFVLAPVVLPPHDVVWDITLASLYLTDYAKVFWSMPEYLGHTWSLSVEEHFYLLWPLVILATRSLSDKRFLLLLIVLFCAATIWRMYQVSEVEDWSQIYCRFDTRLSGLIIGSAVAAVPKKFLENIAPNLGIAALTCLILAGMVLTWPAREYPYFGNVVLDITCAVLIATLTVADTPAFRFLSWKPLVDLGILSYGIYLWHYPIARIFRDEMPPAAAFLVVAVFSYLAAKLSFAFVERPLKDIRRRTLVGVQRPA